MTQSKLVYVGLAYGDQQNRYKLRFCVPHARSVYEDLAEFEVSPEDGTIRGGDSAAAKCFACGEPIDERGWYLYITSYPAKDERKDYWSRLHSDCQLNGYLSKSEYAE